MVRQLLALVSGSALVGFGAVMVVSGCSDATATPVLDSDTVDSSDRNDSGKVPAVAQPGRELCYKEDPIDVSRVAYKPARKQPGACTENVLGVFEALSANNGGGKSLSEIKEAIATQESAACAECVVGEDGDTWAPLVDTGDGKFILNFGGCLEVLSGKATCGKAMQQFVACLGISCSACEDIPDRQDCVDSTQGAACKDANKALVTFCGAGINSYIRACITGSYVNDVGANVIGTIRELCIGSAKDGGNN